MLGGSFHDPPQGKIVRFGRSSCEHDVRWPAARKFGDLLTSHRDGCRLASAELVRSRGVTDPFSEDRQHDLGNPGI